MQARSDIRQEAQQSVRTCDLYMAASLVTAGLRYADPEVTQGRVYFSFANTDNQVTDLRKKYLSRSLQVDALTMGDNVRSLKSRCAELTRKER